MNMIDSIGEWNDTVSYQFGKILEEVNIFISKSKFI
jgi:hypothetical protein